MSCPVCRGAGPFPGGERQDRFVLHLCPGCDAQLADPMEGAGRDFCERHGLDSGREETRGLLASGGYVAVDVPAWRAWRALRDPLYVPPRVAR